MLSQAADEVKEKKEDFLGVVPSPQLKKARVQKTTGKSAAVTNSTTKMNDITFIKKNLFEDQQEMVCSVRLPNYERLIR